MAGAGGAPGVPAGGGFNGGSGVGPAPEPRPTVPGPVDNFLFVSVGGGFHVGPATLEVEGVGLVGLNSDLGAYVALITAGGVGLGPVTSYWGGEGYIASTGAHTEGVRLQEAELGPVGVGSYQTKEAGGEYVFYNLTSSVSVGVGQQTSEVCE